MSLRAILKHVPFKVRGQTFGSLDWRSSLAACIQKNNYNEEKCQSQVSEHTPLDLGIRVLTEPGRCPVRMLQPLLPEERRRCVGCELSQSQSPPVSTQSEPVWSAARERHSLTPSRLKMRQRAQGQ